MHNIFALIIAALLADLVQCLTWAARWLLIWAACVVGLALYFFACLILIHLWCVWWA